MERGTAKWLGLSILFAGLIVTTALGSAVAAAPKTTYTITFTELGLPTGTNWSVTFNSVTTYSTGTTLSVSGIVGGTYYYWSTASTITTSTTTEYTTPTTGAYMTVPNQQSYVLVYTEQVKATFATNPSGTASISPGTGFYPAGTQLAITATPYAGWKFDSWGASSKKDTFANNSVVSTVLTLNAGATITAKLKQTSAGVNFYETGLPSGTIWTVTFAGVGHTSATGTLSTGNHKSGSYAWSAATITTAHNTEYVPFPASGYLSTPNQPTQEINWVKEFQVTFATSPASSGSIYPSATTYYANGTDLNVFAFNTSGYVFNSWTTTGTGLYLGNHASASTNVSISGPGTLTAKFVTGTACTANCTVTFNEVGVPSGTTWGIAANFPNYGSSTYYYSKTGSLTIPKVTAGFSYSVISNIASTTQGNTLFSPVGTTSGYLPLGEINNVSVVYAKYYYVNVVTSLAGTPDGTTGLATSYSGWYSAGSSFAVASYSPTYWTFTSWSSNTSGLTLGSAAKQTSNTVNVDGPGTISANFKQANVAVSFEEYNLPKGMTWGLTINSVLYTTTSAYLNLSLPSNSYGWTASYPLGSPSVAGVEYNPVNYYGSFELPMVNLQSIIFQKDYYVTFAAGGTSGGSVTPSGSTWLAAGSIVAISGINGTSVTFNGWSATTTSGTLSINSVSQASTYVTISGTGKITASFH